MIRAWTPAALVTAVVLAAIAAGQLALITWSVHDVSVGISEQLEQLTKAGPR